MHPKTLGRLLVFILSLRRTVCFASTSSPGPTPPLENSDGENGRKPDHHGPDPIRVASFNKYGGNVKYFDLVAEENTETRDSSSSAIRSTFKNPRFVVTAVSRKLMPALRTTFLPTGFPNKTPHGYLQFCIWSWIQDVSTQLRSVLATQKILEGVGVGREGATALSALFNYLVRDGCGMAANLLFTYAASSRFRTDVKRWRMFADMSVDIGITLEVAATLFPKSLFLPCICLGNMFKALCGVAAGASGGSINLYWAEGSDISDINAKFGAQHTVTGAIGLVFAGIFAKSVSKTSPHTLWLMYFVLTFLHLYGNVKCMRLISFDYLNTIRLNMILRDNMIRGDDGVVLTEMPSPQDIAKREPLWFRIPLFGRIFTRRKTSPSIFFGVAYDEFCTRSGKSIEALKSEITMPQLQSNNKRQPTSRTNDDANTLDDAYIISAGNQRPPSSDEAGISNPCVVVSFFSDVSLEQQTKAYVHAWLLADILQERLDKKQCVVDFKSQLEAEAEAKSLLKSMWGKFLKRCTDAGWDTSRSELQTRGYEVKVV